MDGKNLKDGCEFAKKMVNLERETLLKINAIAREYQTEPFETIKAFACHLLEVGADMRAELKIKARQNNDDGSGEGGSNNEFV